MKQFTGGIVNQLPSEGEFRVFAEAMKLVCREDQNPAILIRGHIRRDDGSDVPLELEITSFILSPADED